MTALLKQQPEIQSSIESDLLDLIIRYQPAISKPETSDDGLSSLLKDLVDLTGTRFGLIARIDSVQGGGSSAKISAVCRKHTDKETPILEKIQKGYTCQVADLEKYFGNPIYLNRALFSNSLSDNPNSGEFSVDLKGMFNYIAFPLSLEKNKLGFICLANKKQGFSYKWLDHLEPLCRFLSNSLVNLETIENLKYREKIILESLEAIPDGFVIYDDQDKLFIFNESYREMYKASADVIKTGETFEKVIRWGAEQDQYKDAGPTPEEREEWVQERLRMHNNPPGPIIQKVDDSKWLRVYESKTKSGYIAGIRADVTEVKMMERDLFNVNQQLESANLKLSQFANLAAHDLQEPLRKIHLFSEILEDAMNDNDSESAEQAFNVIREAIVRARTLVSDLLTFSRLTTQSELEKTDVLLADAFKTAQNDLQMTIEEKNAKLDVQLGNCKVYANRTQIEQLMQNFITNAMKYVSPGTTPEVKIRCKESKDGYAKSFSVTDNGIGIEEKYINTIFEPFRRLHSRKEYSGTGIGLAICKAAVEVHGWEIKVASEVGVGTTFEVVFAPDF